MNIMKIMYERFGIFKERKNIHWVRKILFFIFFLLFLLVALKFGRVYLQNVIKNIELTNESVKAWISTSLSFWGSIIASLLSGTLTIIGVWWTIKYYRDSDAKKSRMECMPFLMLEAKCYTDKEVDRDSVDDGVHVYEIYSKMSKDASEEKILYYRMSLRNIGRGFAYTLVIKTGYNYGGIAYRELIQVNDSGEFCLKIHTSKDIINDYICFGVQYIDCMTNEYIQKYYMKWENKNLGDTKLDYGYPVFLGQTHRIGE